MERVQKLKGRWMGDRNEFEEVYESKTERVESKYGVGVMLD